MKKFGFMLMAGVALCPLTAQAQGERVSRYISVDYEPAPKPTATPVTAPQSEIIAPIQTPAPPIAAQPIAAAPTAEQQPVDFAADTLEHDESGQIITARGNVEMIQAGRKLNADTVQYNMQTDKVMASGNVIVHYPNGDIYTADNFELTDDMKDGFINKLQATLADGSRFWAETGERTDGTKIVMKDAVYTPCEPCKANPEKAPVWQLRASEVRHDKEDARITYENARFELFGVPVAYTPYFSHPDGTVDQKSGLLAPTARFSSDLGASYEQDYYVAIAPDEDATIGTRLFTKQNPMLTGEYRKRFENAEIQTAGGITYSERPDQKNGLAQSVGEEVRGHLFTEGVYNIDDKWRAGLRSEIVSDDQYARQYDITNEDVLENEIYTERFDGRNYAVARAMAFQDVRVSERQREQPMILPEVQASFKGDPNATLGGRWSVDASALGLERDGNGQDMVRGTLETGWQRRDVLPAGLVSTIDLTLRGDAYNVRDRDVAMANGRSTESNEMRGFAQANWQAGLPLVKQLDSGSQIVVEPIVSLTSGTNIDVNNDVPNEDSQDIFLDAPKLFEANRFAGYDRIEDGSRVTYGARTSIYAQNGWNAGVFLGQSRRLERESVLFPEGSGLSERLSDAVGSVDIQAGDYLNMNYRFQLDNETLMSKRHEVTASTNLGFATLSGSYFYATPIANTDLDEPREQSWLYASVPLTDQWTAHGGFQYDFSENEGMRYAAYGLTYSGQCVTVGTTVERELTQDQTGDNGTEIMLRLGFKNLGEFETSGISLGSDEEDSDE